MLNDSGLLQILTYGFCFFGFAESSTNKSAGSGGSHLPHSYSPPSSSLSLSSGTGADLSLHQKLETIRSRAVEWLEARRSPDYGWPSGDTARVVIALASLVQDWPANNDLEARLIVKQLEVELLEKLLRLV